MSVRIVRNQILSQGKDHEPLGLLPSIEALSRLTLEMPSLQKLAIIRQLLHNELELAKALQLSILEHVSGLPCFSGVQLEGKEYSWILQQLSYNAKKSNDNHMQQLQYEEAHKVVRDALTELCATIELDSPVLTVGDLQPIMARAERTDNTRASEAVWGCGPFIDWLGAVAENPQQESGRDDSPN